MVEVGQTVDEIYTAITHRLSLAERLTLASLLLNDLAQSDMAVIDRADSRSEEERQEGGAFTLKKGTAAISNEDKALQTQEPEPKPRLMARLRQIKISANPDLSINHDRHF